MLRILLLSFPLYVFAFPQNPGSCLNALSFDEIRKDRLRNEVGRGAIGDQVKMALMGLRQMKSENPEAFQYELAEQWRDYVSVLEDAPFFKSYELKIGKDQLFTGKREKEYYFLAMTNDVPSQLYYGVRDTPLDANSDWRMGNTRFEKW